LHTDKDDEKATMTMTMTMVMTMVMMTMTMTMTMVMMMMTTTMMIVCNQTIRHVHTAPASSAAGQTLQYRSHALSPPHGPMRHPHGLGRVKKHQHSRFKEKL